jgi:hypothetical protein
MISEIKLTADRAGQAPAGLRDELYVEA